MFADVLTVSGCCLGSWEKPLAEKSWDWCAVSATHWVVPGAWGLWSLTLNGIISLSVTWARLAPPARCRYLFPTQPTASGVRQTNKWVEEHLLKLRGYQHWNISVLSLRSDLPTLSPAARWRNGSVHSFNCQAKGLRRGRQRLQKQTLNLSWEEEEDGRGPVLWSDRLGLDNVLLTLPGQLKHQWDASSGWFIESALEAWCLHCPGRE